MDDSYSSSDNEDHRPNGEQEPEEEPEKLPEKPPARKPVRPRPESTMALDFSNALDGVFNLGGDLGLLNDSVEQKKLNVTSQSQELQELEARLKAAEERLKKAGLSGPPPPLPQSTQATVGEQEPETPTQVPPSGAPAPPRRAAPTRVEALASSSLEDRVPTPMDPTHRGQGLPASSRRAAEAVTDA